MEAHNTIIYPVCLYYAFFATGGGEVAEKKFHVKKKFR
jgi:hypothetical protein